MENNKPDQIANQTEIPVSGNPPPPQSHSGLRLLVLALLVAIGVFAIGFWWRQGWRGKETVQPAAPVPAAVKPPPNLVSANARITNISNQGAVFVFEVQAVGPEKWSEQKTWKVVLGKDTILATLSEYEKANMTDISGKPISQGSPMEVLEVKDFKPGDEIYIIAGSGQDLGKLDEVINPHAILLQ